MHVSHIRDSLQLLASVCRELARVWRRAANAASASAQGFEGLVGYVGYLIMIFEKPLKW
jgi:preprotein translocase subunit Sss1